MKDFAAIDFETANEQRTSVCSVGVVIVRDEGLPLVAHNKAFDESCLKAVFRTYCMDYPDYEFYCTLQASRRAIKGLPNYQLHTVAVCCGYQLEHHHHALADAEACAWIAKQVI